LVEQADARVLGAVFSVAHEELEAKLGYLDLREQAGYERRTHDVDLREGGRISALVYLATPTNPSWLGPAPARSIAEHVTRSRGPSGWNRDYVVGLAGALRKLGLAHHEEEEVFEVERSLGSLIEPSR